MDFKQFLKEKSAKTYVYHVSPSSDIGRLRATGSRKGQQSIHMGQGGIYVAPKFTDVVAWSVSYVVGKKYNTQKPNKRLKELGRGWHGEKGPRNYENLTIYKIEIPKKILENIWSNTFWEPEYFIPEKYLDQMKIVQSKTYSIDELSEIYSRRQQKRLEVSATLDINRIKKLSKTNKAAKYYLELIDLYNNNLLRGKKPVLTSVDFVNQNEHLIRQKIEKLREYIFSRSKDFYSAEPITKLNKNQEKQIEELYINIKNMMENL